MTVHQKRERTFDVLQNLKTLLYLYKFCFKQDQGLNVREKAKSLVALLKVNY